MFRFLEGGGADLQGGIFPQTFRNAVMHAFRVNPSHDWVPALVDVFAPDSHSDGINHARGKDESGKQESRKLNSELRKMRSLVFHQ